MKKRLLPLLLTLVFLISCSKGLKSEKIEENALSNMAGGKSSSYVEKNLKKNLDRKNVDKFIKLVDDYNERVGSDKLVSGFTTNLRPPYDLGGLVEQFQKSKGDFPPSNCRINTFLLLKDDMKVSPHMNVDDSLLFMDEEMLEKSKLLTKDERDDFESVFSRVKTKSSKDPKVHAKVMKKHLEKIDFPENVHMLSVIIHDNLDGDYLFIVHVGVLEKIDGGYLFVEKLSFEEPYQAIKFKSKKDAYKYLAYKYENFKDPNTAPPFIMDNDDYVESDWFWLYF